MRVGFCFKTALFVLFFSLVGSGSQTHGAELPLLDLQKDYVGEDQGLSHKTMNRKVKYITDPNEARKNVLTIKDGRFYAPDKKPFHTLGTSFVMDNGVSMPFDRAIVVQDADGVFRFLTDPVAYETHHSTLVAGKSVKFAGEILCDDGYLKVLTDRSGHYKPTLRHTHEFLKGLEATGVDVSKIQVKVDLGAVMEFFNHNYTAGELDDFVRFSFKSAVNSASHFSLPVFQQFWRTYPGRPSLSAHIKANPKPLFEIFDQTVEPMAPYLQKLFLPVIEANAESFFTHPVRLAHFAESFTSENVVASLWPRAQAIVEKASQKGLHNLTVIELNTLGLMRTHMITKKGWLGLNPNRELIKKFDQQILDILKVYYPNKVMKLKAMDGFYKEIAVTKNEGLPGMATGIQQVEHCSVGGFLRFMGL